MCFFKAQGIFRTAVVLVSILAFVIRRRARREVFGDSTRTFLSKKVLWCSSLVTILSIAMVLCPLLLFSVFVCALRFCLSEIVRLLS